MNEAATDHSIHVAAMVATIQEALDVLVAWSQAHPDMRVIHSSGTRWIVPADTHAHADRVRALADGAGVGEIKKIPVGESLHVCRSFGADVSLTAVISDREEVCTRRVIGTETVEIPDPDAPKIAVQQEIVEWDCHSLLGDDR